MCTDHPVYYFLIVNIQWCSRFTMRERCHHGSWAQQHIPFLEELLPGVNGLVTGRQSFQILCEGDWSFLLFRLECPGNHANYFSSAQEFLVEIQRWQRCFFNGFTQGMELLC